MAGTAHREAAPLLLAVSGAAPPLERLVYAPRVGVGRRLAAARAADVAVPGARTSGLSPTPAVATRREAKVLPTVAVCELARRALGRVARLCIPVGADQGAAALAVAGHSPASSLAGLLLARAPPLRLDHARHNRRVKRPAELRHHLGRHPLLLAQVLGERVVELAARVRGRHRRAHPLDLHPAVGLHHPARVAVEARDAEPQPPLAQREGAPKETPARHAPIRHAVHRPFCAQAEPHCPPLKIKQKVELDVLRAAIRASPAASTGRPARPAGHVREVLFDAACGHGPPFALRQQRGPLRGGARPGRVKQDVHLLLGELPLGAGVPARVNREADGELLAAVRDAKQADDAADPDFAQPEDARLHALAVELDRGRRARVVALHQARVRPEGEPGASGADQAHPSRHSAQTSEPRLPLRPVRHFQNLRHKYLRQLEEAAVGCPSAE
mmetsp:Transcript_3718/g.12229  ORF Transcript_3718/g.12229 Transcript_3718/m.12229 type:complete len:444 (-) Transcript_3718:231-1562(-)